MAQRITRRLEIDAGHRLLGHEGKCRNYHGHRYVFDVTVEAPTLDTVGRVVDFSVVKEKVGGWLDRYWDHGMILQVGDPLIDALHALAPPAALITTDATNRADDAALVIACSDPKFYVLPDPPTAENLAAVLYEQASFLLRTDTGGNLRVVKVVCHETPNCAAEYP